MIDTWTPPQANEIIISGAGPQVMVFLESLTGDSDVQPGWETTGRHKAQMFQR